MGADPFEKPDMPTALPEMYRHWKGGYYLLIRIAQHHEDGEHWAVYRPVDGDESQLYVRPWSQWHERVALHSAEEGEELHTALRFAPVTAAEGEQVAIDRLKAQIAKAREQAEGDPEGEMVVGLTEHLIETLQERLNAARQQ